MCIYIYIYIYFYIERDISMMCIYIYIYVLYCLVSGESCLYSVNNSIAYTLLLS